MRGDAEEGRGMRLSKRVHNQIQTRVADGESNGTKNNIAQQ